MKIVCDACQAKYSISDDKVQGKVFKIRCKKCSNIIVVRGGANAAEAAPAPQEKDTRVYDYGYDGGGGAAGGGDDAVWHLVISQDQVGPMTVGEVQQRFASGEIDGETFAWREGFADWLPLAQVDAFAGLIASGSTTSASGGGGGAAAIGAMFGSSTDDGGGSTHNDDLFAAASNRGHHSDDDGGGDLFGSKQPAAAASSAASSSANSKLRGERNENSVLFSLNNLAQLASDKPAISTPSSQSGHATGAAGGEGSGLIDIRSMASAYMGNTGASLGKPQTASAIGSIDDLPVFGGGGFSEPAVIVPTMSRGRDNKILYLMIGAVTLLAVVAIVMVVMLMKGKKEPTPIAQADTPSKVAGDDKANAGGGSADTGSAANTGSATQVAQADTGSANAATPVAPTPTTNKAAAPTPPPTPSHKAATPSTSSSSSSSHTSTHTSSAPVAKAEPTPAASKTPPASDSGGGGCDEVSCVINSYAGACCAKFHKGGGGGGGGNKPAPSSGGGDLPDSLDRGMISSAIANVKARVTACGEKSSAKGKVKVHVKVAGNGSVSSVNVETTPDAGLGSCVQAAVQKATFAKTQSGGSFSYPFVF
ncbi:MAG TPA: GYF domain-containing protein [Kofleriaceae bacterium]|jgi:predicted Zn finger-like uncharacterized protein|nr:GYF domain-containing protein [Kofleriaceae bacterium]